MLTNLEAMAGDGLSGSVGIDGTLYVLAVPDKVIARITPEPRLPPIPIAIRMNPGFSLNGELTYSAAIEYIEHGRTDKIQVTGRSATPAFAVNFGDIIQGGRFVISLSVPWRHTNGQTGSTGTTGESSVRGQNPSKSDIRSRLGSIEAQVTGYRESRFRQFGSDDLPLFGPPNGFGVMQLDNPPATAREVWDWKANVDAGLALFRQKAADARGYPARVRKQYPEATNFTPEQLKLETYQRYNGGAYWKWDDAQNAWTRAAPNRYGDESLALERAVSGGRPPSDWG